MEDKYEKQIFKSKWSELKEHAKRDGLIIIDPNIKLASAAKAIVENNTEQVSNWIESKDFVKPTQEQLDTWSANKEKEFIFFIAQPYVLIQEIWFQ